MLIRLLLACLPIVVPAVATAQSGRTAHLYAYTVKDRAAFEAGYRQHLRWHAQHASATYSCCDRSSRAGRTQLDWRRPRRCTSARPRRSR